MELGFVFLDWNSSFLYDVLHNPWSLAGCIIAFAAIFYAIKPAAMEHIPNAKIPHKKLRLTVFSVAVLILISVALFVK